MSLFDPGPADGEPIRQAVFSDCERYRYALYRHFGPGRRLVFVMLNPSTADDQRDDATLRRCIGFMHAWDYSTLAVVNLFSWRARDPKDMVAAWRAGQDIDGPANAFTIRAELRQADLVVAAWGAGWRPIGHKPDIEALAREAGRDLHCLGWTKQGDPRHPLYLPTAAKLEPYALHGVE